jgi:hypothetical protein
VTETSKRLGLLIIISADRQDYPVMRENHRKLQSEGRKKGEGEKKKESFTVVPISPDLVISHDDPENQTKRSK